MRPINFVEPGFQEPTCHKPSQVFLYALRHAECCVESEIHIKRFYEGRTSMVVHRGAEISLALLHHLHREFASNGFADRALWKGESY